MILYRSSLPAATAMLSLAGCATTSPPKSGFLGDYTGLVKEQGERVVAMKRDWEHVFPVR